MLFLKNINNYFRFLYTNTTTLLKIQVSVISTVKYYKLFGDTLTRNLWMPLLSISKNDDTTFSKFLKDIFGDENLNTTLFEVHTKGSGFTIKLLIIIFIITILLYLLNVKSYKTTLLSSSKNFYFNPFILWIMAWIIDIFILLIRFFFFNDKYLDLQFIFVPSILIWILFRVFFFKKKTIDINVNFLDDWLHYQLKFKPAKIFFDKISKNKDLNKSKLFYWSIQIFILDSTICTLRILIYGCLILGRLDFTISFCLFLMMIYIYKKKLK